MKSERSNSSFWRVSRFVDCLVMLSIMKYRSLSLTMCVELSNITFNLHRACERINAFDLKETPYWNESTWKLKMSALCCNKHVWPSLILRESKETSHSHQLGWLEVRLLAKLGMKTIIIQDNSDFLKIFCHYLTTVITLE